MRNFDQWTEQLSKQIDIGSDEQEKKLLWKADEDSFEEDQEEEE